MSVTDLPTGWAEIPLPSNQAQTCNTQPFAQANPTANARQYFQQNGGIPLLEEQIATFADTSAAFTKVKADLDTCRSFNATASGQTVHETQGAMSFPTVGDESAAWTDTFMLQGLGVVGDIIVARKGNQLLGLALIDLGSVDLGQLQQFVNSALDKLPAG